ncbi:MAG: hypothetical protein KDI73_10375 [Candidatus Competibacteraceae bacterium]|nr:hypothetical protein [Candidatus Competibacteraceae bacterium]
MDEYIAAAILRGDKTETLRFVKPLHSTNTHYEQKLKKKFSFVPSRFIQRILTGAFASQRIDAGSLEVRDLYPRRKLRESYGFRK